MTGPRSGRPRTPGPRDSSRDSSRDSARESSRERETHGTESRHPADRQEGARTPPGTGPRPEPQPGVRDRTTQPSRTTGPEAPHRPAQDTSVGDLISEVAGDLTRLVRNEIDLAKAEVKEEGRKAGKAAALFGGAGYAVGLALLLASFAAVYGLAHVIGNAWAALVVAAVWAVAGAVLQAAGRKRMGTVQPTPERSRESLREDVKWARHPTS